MSTKTVDANSIDQDGNFKFELYYNDPSLLEFGRYPQLQLISTMGQVQLHILQTLSKSLLTLLISVTVIFRLTLFNTISLKTLTATLFLFPSRATQTRFRKGLRSRILLFRMSMATGIIRLKVLCLAIRRVSKTPGLNIGTI